MEKFVNYVNRFQEGNQYGLYFIENKLGDGTYKDGDNTVELSQTDIEHILDFIYSKQRYFKNIGLKTLKEKAEAWSKKLQEQASAKDDEVEGEDYEIVYDFGDGYKFVKLLSQKSYEREGKLMSHCVASYYERDTKIFSLRDEKNLPHATIEENNQVKGKGNQTVDNKYFDYCIKFLEYKGYSIGENEMKNIGYHKLESIDKDLWAENKYLYDGKYISEDNLDKIKDKDGNQYYGFGLLNIKSLFNFDLNMNVNFNFDIQKIKEYFISNIGIGNNTKSSGDDSELSGGDYSELAGGDYSKLAGGNGSKLAGGNGSELAGGDSSELAGGIRSKLAGGDDSELAGGIYSKLAGGNDSELAGGDSSELAGGNGSKLAGGIRSKLAGGDDSELSGGDYSELAGGDYSKLAGGNDSELAGGDSSELAGGIYSKLVGGNGSKLAGGNGSELAGGDSSKLAGGNGSKLSGGDDSKLAGGDYSKLSGGIYSKLVGGDSSKLILNGKNGLAIGGHGTKFKGKKGNYFAIGEKDKDGNYINFKTVQIDGKIIKEDTLYKFEDGEFVEVNERE